MGPDFILSQDIKQADRVNGRKCPFDADHGRLTVMGNGLALMCGNRMTPEAAKHQHENGKPVVRLEASKVFVCGYTEPIGQ